MIHLAALAPLLNGCLLGQDKPVSGVSTDSRSIKQGDVFVALRGARFDGHEFLAQAIANGAMAVVVDVEQSNLDVPQLVVADTTRALGQIGAYNRRQFAGEVIAVTGSSGKTSVKGMLREVLAACADVAVTPGNFNNHIGVPLSLMLLREQAYAVIELGTNQPGEIGYLTELVLPDVALVNNIMPAHIGGFGSLSAIAQEKSAIYQHLTPEQTAVINADEAFCKMFEDKTQHCHRLGFSIAGAEKNYPLVTAENIRDVESGVAFDLIFDAQKTPVELSVPGRHSVSNALAAAACALAAGFPFDQLARGLANFRGEAGRMQREAGIGEAVVIDDTYNANPGSVKAAIDYLSSCAGKRILVLGDLGELGDIAAEAHRELGAYAREKQLDALYSVGQFAHYTISGFGEGGRAFDAKVDLVDQLIPSLMHDVTVLVKGSRSARMEAVVEALRLKETPTC